MQKDRVLSLIREYWIEKELQGDKPISFGSLMFNIINGISKQKLREHSYGSGSIMSITNDDVIIYIERKLKGN